MDFVRQIEANRRALLEELFRRIEEAIEPFGYALDAFLERLFRGILPTDWRTEWHEFVDQQAGEGFMVTPESVDEFEDWMEAWARFCKLLPGTAETDTIDSRAVQRLDTSEAIDYGSDSAVQFTTQSVEQDSPFRLVGFKSRTRDKTPAVQPSKPTEPAPKSHFNKEGFEIAGPGPETTASYRAKVQNALETLDPKVANWWRANSV